MNAVQKVAAMTNKAERDKKEIERLRSTHQLYDLFIKDWQFYLDAYSGGKSMAKKDYIDRHPREHPDDYDERVKRLHYMNYCKPLIEFFTDFIYADMIQRDGGANNEFLYSFIKDVNKKGDDITTFMEELCNDMQIFGTMYVLVDAPKLADGMKLSIAQQQQKGIRPYWVMMLPMEIYDWVKDPFDNYIYLKRRAIVNEYDSTSGLKVLERFTEWTQDSIRITDIDITQGEGKEVLLPAEVLPNRLKNVPVLQVCYKRDKLNKDLGESFLKDLAMQAKEVMNLTSLLQEFLYRQCFNILTKEVDFNIPPNDVNGGGDLGTNNVLEYPKGAQRPEYIAPQVTAADKLQDERQRIIEHMYRFAAQNTINELFNGGKASGHSKAMSFSTTVPKIASRAEILEDVENTLMTLTLKYMNRDWDGKIIYKDHYEVTVLTDAIDHMVRIFGDLHMPSPTFAVHELKRMVSELDNKIPSEDLIQINKEIEALLDNAEYLKWADRVANLTEIKQIEGNMVTQNTNTNTDNPAPAAQAAISGKDKPASKTTPTRPTSTTAEIKAESTKKKK